MVKSEDQNTKYFFNYIKGRGNINTINNICLEDGRIITKKDNVKEEFISFFYAFFEGKVITWMKAIYKRLLITKFP